MHFSNIPMHIPDGFLSALVSIFLWIITAIVLAIALKRVSNLGERQLPLMGVLAAAIFAGQMLNFSVAGGTSGHLMGAAIATILLGPWAAILVMTSVVSLQALIFQDGGLLALGANIFNMGIVGVTVAHLAYAGIQKFARGRAWGIFAGGFSAAWLSIELASLAVALQLAISGTTPANIAIPAMGGVHALIGIGEGLVTLGALSFLFTARRDLFEVGDNEPQGITLLWWVGLVIALGLAVASPLASANPDGLEWVAEQAGFLDRAQRPVFEIIPDYIFPGVSNQVTATILAGLVGTAIVFTIWLVVAILRRRASKNSWHD